MEHAGIHRPYRPSNSIEGDIFMAEWCANCVKANLDDVDRACIINLRAIAHQIDDPEYPEEWQFSNGGVPFCSAFSEGPVVKPQCDQTPDMFERWESTP